MAVLDSTKTVKALFKKGFKSDDSHHKYLHFYYNGNLTHISTKVSHNGQDIGNNLISAMSKQLKLEKKDFLKLVTCTLSEDGYILILENKGEL